MCGIFGFWLNRPVEAKDLALGQTGVEALHHRGPDHADTWTDVEQGLFMGHTRLSIIDLSKHSNQPMVRDGAVLVYNGEIYNYRELADELSAEGTVFSSAGDTEVLIQAWNRWGPECLHRFDGMFAFALYHNGSLHLATDPFGEKPLYWARANGGIYFASEPHPLVDQLHLSPHFSSQDIAAFLSLGYLPAPSTGYKNLFRMPPGTWLTCHPNGRTTVRTYWTPPRPVNHKSPLKALTETELDTISDALIESLRLRLRADVPLGIFLSSGVDSTLVATLAAKELHQETLAFTVKFPDQEVADESALAATVAQYLGLPHKIVNSEADPSRTDPSIVFDLFGEANDNLTVASAYQMSKLAASTLKVALSGIGGDELFYGYNKYQLAYKWRHWLGLNASVRNAISRFDSPQFPRKWSQLSNLLSASDACQFIALKNTNVCRWLWTLPQIESWAQELFSNTDIPIGLLGRHIDLQHTLPATFIPAIERGSMRASLEVRTPFLNRNLLDVISKMDQRAFLAFGQKSVLHRILRRYVPEKLLSPVKKGFKYPKGEFLTRLSNKPPQVDGIEPSHIKKVWQHRHTKDWRGLAVRLVILDHFLNSKQTLAPSMPVQRVCV